MTCFDSNIQDNTGNTRQHKQLENLFHRQYVTMNNGSLLFMMAIEGKYFYMAKKNY
jgi:hypothetical protein